MVRYAQLFLIVFSFTLLVACSPDTGPEPKSSAPEIADEILPDETNPQDENIGADDNCGSLKPLLGLLPPDKEMGGLPETYRGCDNASEQTVSVIYSNEGEEYSEYQFKIYVLNPESVYAKANMTIENATTEQQAFINKAFQVAGDMHKIQLDTCHHYHQNPMIPDGRNPLIVQVQNLDVCVIDNMDANKEIWNLYTIKNDLEFRLELKGHKAGEIKTTEVAGDQLTSLFDKFGLNQNP